MQTTKSLLTSMALVLVASLCLAAAPQKPPKKTQPAAKQKRPAGPTKLLLKQIPSVSLAKMPLMRVLDHYGKLSGLTVQADWAALKTVGITKATPVTLKARKIRFEKLLDLTLNSIAPKNHPLSWYLSGKVVHVSTQMRILLRDRVALLPLRKVKAAKRTGLAPREINFSELPLKSVIEFFRDLSGVNFHVNWRALEATGITRETPITVKARNISIARALDLVTDQLSVGRDRYSSIYWIIQGGVVEISTGEAFDRTTKVRTYEIGDILMVVPNFKGPKIDISQGSNNAGNNNGGGIWTDDDDDDEEDEEGESIADQRKRIRKTLIEIIKMSIGEDMWHPTGKGSIKILRNKLIISQTPLGFKLLERSMAR